MCIVLFYTHTVSVVLPVNKSRINISIDPEILEKFDRNVVGKDGERSKEISKLMEKALNVHQSEDPELKRKVQKFRNRKEEREQTKKEVDQEIQDLEEKISLYEQKLEEREQKQSDLSEAVDALGSRLRSKRSNTRCNDWSDALDRLASSEPFWDWVDRLDVESDELKDRLRSEFVEARQQ